MRNKISTLLILALLIAGAVYILPQCYERIPAGYAGVRENLYGSDKGVDEVTEVSGMVWFNPLLTRIHKFPKYIQNIVFTKDAEEGSLTNEEIRVTTNDGLIVSLDVSVNYQIDPDKVVDIFVKYRKPLSEISKTIVRNYVRNAYNQAANTYTAEEIYTKKTEFIKKAEALFKTDLGKEGFIIDNVILLNELRLPDNIKKAIDRKIEAKQIAQMKKNELEQSKADAMKKVEQSRGEAEAMKIEADAERYAFEQKQKALTKLLVQQQMIEKWDGKLPVYGAVPALFQDVTTK
jgi:regulator of protease activity HflC (stomatin/prohibitin superfamily)